MPFLVAPKSKSAPAIKFGASEANLARQPGNQLDLGGRGREG